MRRESKAKVRRANLEGAIEKATDRKVTTRMRTIDG